MKFSLDKVRLSGDVSSVEHMINGVQKALDSLTLIIRTVNFLRGNLVTSRNDLTASEFINEFLKPSLMPGWGVEAKGLCDGVIHSNKDLLCASLNEIVLCLAPSGRLEVTVSQGRMDMLELGMPLHLASHKFLRLDFFPANAESRNGSEDKTMVEARLRATSAILKHLGCACKAITTAGATSTVLIPARDKNAS
jgi:hypothetical protein